MDRLDFADGLPHESDDIRFMRRNRFCRNLRADQFLDVMLKYR